MFALLLLVNGAFLLALVLTGFIRRYALHAQLIDHASNRSAHTQPTPRGGGLSIVIATVVALLASVAVLGVPRDVALGLAGGGAAVALVGWLDDHGHVSPLVRLSMHFLSAIWLIWWVGWFPIEKMALWNPNWTIGARILTALFIVWMINLYNFMDGIDGLAAGGAIVISLGGAMLLVATGFPVTAMIVPPLILAAATFGFLPWNWPPARIFMGDASSGFLGFMLAALAICMGRLAPQVSYAWAILPGAFIADATVALVRRFMRGEPVYQAHRAHAYQRWTRRLNGHLPVTMAILIVTWAWLFPIAFLIAQREVGEVSGSLAAMLPLFVAALMLGSGRPDE